MKRYLTKLEVEPETQKLKVYFKDKDGGEEKLLMGVFPNGTSIEIMANTFEGVAEALRHSETNN